MNLMQYVEEKYVASQRVDAEGGKRVADFGPGDTVRVSVTIREGDKERQQLFEGVVIERTGGTGTRACFTVRKVSNGVGVERVFPVYSPFVTKVERVSEGRVRRARLFYLRKLSGKAARIREKRKVVVVPSTVTAASAA